MPTSRVQSWLLLVHQLPPKPTSLRVRIWRKLQQLGAVAVKNSIYVLPFTEKTHEDFQWLRQEIATCGGEATVFQAKTVEGTTDKEIMALFHRARDEDYARVTAAFESLAGALREEKRGGRVSAGRLAHFEIDTQKLRSDLDEIAATDFFGARGRAAAFAAYESCRKLMQGVRRDRKQPTGNMRATDGMVDLLQYQGRRWLTRKHLHIDRLACIWLIKRFVDGRARFSFITDGEPPKNGVGFDMFGADLTHHGEDCTFETMLKRFGLTGNPALCGMAEVVHDIDLKDRKFSRKEAPGLDAVVTGLGLLLKNDHKLAQQAAGIFDGLYALLGKPAPKTQTDRHKTKNPKTPAKR